MTAASLAAWRARLQVNKSEAARRLGLSRNAYDGYESGRKRIPLYVALAAAALAFGLPPIP
jgi:transcriptional regulator with XRE-family HTH domain